MKIENLKCFLAVVRSGSLHKAANELFLTPQNLSTIIKNIEHDVGAELFVRTSKGMVLSAEGERFLPYAMTIYDTYQQYFDTKKTTSNILSFYTTPALASELTDLQGALLADQYYLSIQSRSVADLYQMLQKSVPGVYLIMTDQEKLQKVDAYPYTKILRCNENIVLCHKNNRHALQKIEPKKIMVITQDYYEGDYGDFLRMNDLTQIKSMLRQKNAVYNCVDYHYNKNFQEEDEWVVLQRNAIPQFDLLLFGGMYDARVEKELEQRLKQVLL